MAGNTIGRLFRVTTAGESHGAGQVVIVDGCPPDIALSIDDLAVDLARRRPGQSAIVTQRREGDQAEILSGVFEGRTLGTPIAILIRNQDARSQDYEAIKELYRPGHADFGFDAKYGRRDYRGGGRSSARETVTRVAAGAIAKKVLHALCGAEVLAYVTRAGSVAAKQIDPLRITLGEIETFADGTPNPTRCPDHEAARQMLALIEQVRRDQDSIGGIAEIVARGVPAGLGEPVFDKLKADLGKALLSIPAVLGVEYGAGFEVARLKGSECNDAFVSEVDTAGGARIATRTNRHGGILGGISTGMPIVWRAAVKPTSSLSREQDTVRRDGTPGRIRTTGRHDPCLLPRFVPVAEAMAAIVLADHLLRWRGQCGRTS
ncbi:MAG: chorismate synthase [Vicinamibacteria bacterium]|jgi:chorismate synthase|nr:chorismate synthase [Vicinamibacteria bacterium]